MQRILNRGDMQNTSLNSDKIQYTLITGTRTFFLCHHIQKSETFKNGAVFWPTGYIFLFDIVALFYA